MNTRRNFFSWFGASIAALVWPKSAGSAPVDSLVCRVSVEQNAAVAELRAKSLPKPQLHAMLKRHVVKLGKGERLEEFYELGAEVGIELIDVFRLDAASHREAIISARVAESSFAIAHRHYTGDRPECNYIPVVPPRLTFADLKDGQHTLE
jgi:hypothetical protein